MSISQDVPDWGGPAITGSGVTLVNDVVNIPPGGLGETPILYCGSWPAMLLDIEQNSTENVNYEIQFFADPLGASGGIYGRQFNKASTASSIMVIPIMAPYFQVSGFDNGVAGAQALVSVSYSSFGGPGAGLWSGVRVISNAALAVPGGTFVTLTPQFFTPGKAWIYFEGQATSTVLMQALGIAAFGAYALLPCAAGVSTFQEIIVPQSDWNLIVTNNAAGPLSYHLSVVYE